MIGMRIIKSGIAVMVSAFIAEYFHLSTPFFICMTSFITMERTLLTSIELGKSRVLGTAIGALIGGVLSVYFQGNPLVAGLAVMASIMICRKLKLNGGIIISGIVCIACILHISEGDGLFYAYHRTVETFLGMLVSLVVNIAILPYYNIESLVTLQNDLIIAINNNESLEVPYTKLANNIELYRNEILNKSKQQKLKILITNLEVFTKIKQHHDILKIVADDNIREYHLEMIKKLSDSIDTNL